jgi:hypothetical protein
MTTFADRLLLRASEAMPSVRPVRDPLLQEHPPSASWPERAEQHEAFGDGWPAATADQLQRDRPLPREPSFREGPGRGAGPVPSADGGNAVETRPEPIIPSTATARLAAAVPPPESIIPSTAIPRLEPAAPPSPTSENRRPPSHAPITDQAIRPEPRPRRPVSLEDPMRRSQAPTAEPRRSAHAAASHIAQTPVTPPSGENPSRQDRRLEPRGLAAQSPVLERPTRFMDRRTPAEAAGLPPIKVTIGRVEVRAIVEPPAAPKKSRASSPPPMSLSTYLEQRRRGGR